MRFMIPATLGLAISPILCWIAWCSMRNLPKVRLDRANAMDSSTQVLAILQQLQHMQGGM